MIVPGGIDYARGSNTSRRVLSEGGNLDVDAHLVEWDGVNPFFASSSLAENDDGKSLALGADVLSFSFKVNGKALVVNNTPEPFRIRMKLVASAAGENYTKPNCTDHRVDCPHMLEAGVSCEVDFADYPGMGINGTMKSLCADTCNSTCEEQVPAAGCSYYDRTMLMWRTDGKVVETDNVSVLCEFNHLTDFGAMFGRVALPHTTPALCVKRQHCRAMGTSHC